MSSRISGMTFVEVTVSTALLGVLLLAATVAVKTSMDSAHTSIDLSEDHEASDRLWEDVQDCLRCVARSTLQGVPSAGTTAEPLVDGELYGMIQFRIRTEASTLDSSLEPALGEKPYGLAFQERTGTLLVHDRRGSRTLARNVAGFSVAKKDMVLWIRLVRVVDGEKVAEERSLVLRNP